MTDIYARDMNQKCLTDAFMGKGFEKMLMDAEAHGKDVIVGHFVENAYIDE